jgi:hypothetical protein
MSRSYYMSSPPFASIGVVGLLYLHQSGTGTGFSPSFPFSLVNMIPPLLSTMDDEQQARQWLQFRDMVSPHQHEQQHKVSSNINHHRMI